MELEFKKAPPNFSVPFSGHPKAFAAPTSSMCCHWSHQDLRAICSVAHLWTICSVVPSDGKLSRAGWDNVWVSFSGCLLWVKNSSLTMSTGCVLAAPLLFGSYITSVVLSQVCSQYWGCSPGDACLAPQGLGLFEILVSCLLKIASCNTVQYSSKGSKIACWDKYSVYNFHVLTATQSWLNNRI